MLQQLLAIPPPMPGIMYGLDGYLDDPDLPDYDPWAHAELLGAKIVSSILLPPGVVAAYSHEMHIIFYRPGQPIDVERCCIAHELVHWEHRDRGKSAREEARANRVSTLRLIRPSRIAELALDQGDLEGIARGISVTKSVMQYYARMARNGTLPRSSDGTDSSRNW